MPEKEKMAVEKENTSPAKNKNATLGRGGGGYTVAQVTMLDGSVLDVNIEVRDNKQFKESCLFSVVCVFNCCDKTST